MRLHSARTLRALLPVAMLLVSASAVEAQQPAAATPQAADSAITLTPAERARYVGVYELDTPDGVMPIHVFEQGEILMARPEQEDEPSPLTPLGDHRFRPVLLQEAVITFSVEEGRAANFVMDFPDERGTMMAFRRP